MINELIHVITKIVTDFQKSLILTPVCDQHFTSFMFDVIQNAKEM